MLLRRFSSGGRNASAYHPRSGAEFSSAAEMAELIAANPVRKARFPGLNGWSSCDRAGCGCARAFLSNQQTTATQSRTAGFLSNPGWSSRSEEHTSELQSRLHLVCRLLLEKKK